MADGTFVEVNQFIDFLYGRENCPTYGVIARLVQDNVRRRPAVGGLSSRWPDFEAMRTHVRLQTNIPERDLNAAIAAFRNARA